MNGQTGWAPPTFLKKKEAEVIIRVDSVETELEESADSDGYIKVQPSCESSTSVCVCVCVCVCTHYTEYI